MLRRFCFYCFSCFARIFGWQVNMHAPGPTPKRHAPLPGPTKPSSVSWISHSPANQTSSALASISLDGHLIMTVPPVCSSCSGTKLFRECGRQGPDNTGVSHGAKTAQRTGRREQIPREIDTSRFPPLHGQDSSER